ncbi:MAG TPA: cysteine--tRNA ligase [Nitrospirota bacterium]|nr:cysteine--tRNA ligase [Nitrospirota bacterium]
MLRVYNTLTAEKEDFVPLKPGEVGMYACGVTVYDHSHLGHARGAVVFDVVRKYLRHKGYNVKYVRNFTDVDDKIIKRAAEAGTTWKELAEKYTDEYIKDMARLGVERPDVEPRATGHIPEIIDNVRRLVERGYAYESGGDVFFSVRKFAPYGKLSKKPLDDMMSGARVDVDERKNDPLDFVLWKASKPGEPVWDSPWGPGRPGWHIECSAMSMKHLGETFDIHAGGMDLQFPHHENEIAQAEAASGKKFVRYWMHNGFVNVNREKMSKSLGNFFTIKEILENYEPEAVRFFLLSTHYRNPIDFSDQSLQDSRAALDRYYTMLEGLDRALAGHQAREYAPAELAGPAAELHAAVEAFKGRFEEAMDDDFNTASAVGAVFELVREVNRVTSDQALLMDDPRARDVLESARGALRGAADILNVFDQEPDAWFGRDREYITIKAAGDELAEILAGLSELGVDVGTGQAREAAIPAKAVEGLIEDRDRARASKDWGRADKIRNALLKAKIELLDSPEGTKWQVKE